jgi:nucleoside-diphosphate-sugar epimerase
MRVFLTGATGYIGGAVLEALRRHDHDVVALVRAPEKAKALAERGCATIILGDMCEPHTWQAEAARSDAIVHAAQLRFGRRIDGGWVRRATVADRTVSRALLDAAESGGRCRAFVFTSGVSAFGDHGVHWIDEAVTGAPSEIGKYHLDGERFVLDGLSRKIPVVVLRPGLPYAAAGGTFANFFLANAVKRRFEIVGDGTNFFPCEHLDDLAEAYALAVERPPTGETIALVDDEPLTMNDFGDLLLSHFGGGKVRRAPGWFVGLFAGGPLARMLGESYRVKNTKAKTLLGWRPRYATIRDGLPTVVAQYRR